MNCPHRPKYKQRHPPTLLVSVCPLRRNYEPLKKKNKILDSDKNQSVSPCDDTNMSLPPLQQYRVALYEENFNYYLSWEEGGFAPHKVRVPVNRV